MRRILVVFLICIVGGVCRGEEENNTLSQALQALDVRKFDQAQALFDRYIGALPEKEQALFQDVSFVSSRSEMEIYKDAADPAEMIRRFWARLDPSPLTQTNERLLEHYKRVAHARIHFSEGRFPWDDRGEVHIRFGAPDHISSSRDMQMEMDREIQDARINFVNRRRLALAIKPGQPIFPVSSMVRWEYWVYVNLERGTEITFVSQFPKVFEYAQIPDGLGVSLTADLMAFQGAWIVQDLVSKSPSVYVPDFADLPIDFFYYSAGFRGSDGQTRLEVYYGLPASEMSRLPVNERTDLVMLDRGLALYDSLWHEVHRVQDQLTFHMPTEQQVMDGSFIPGEIDFKMAPGTYHMALQVRDVVSGKSQVYQQEIILEDFAIQEVLLISDIELAFWVGETEEQGDFVKKNIKVIPMSSRSFRKNQNAFVYFEIYNLKRDEFGQSKYRVEYKFRSRKKRAAPAKVLNGFGRLLRLKEKDREVVIAYEQTGSKQDEVAYVELDLREADPGGQEVQVTVTDVLSDQDVSKSIAFTISP